MQNLRLLFCMERVALINYLQNYTNYSVIHYLNKYVAVEVRKQIRIKFLINTG